MSSCSYHTLARYGDDSRTKNLEDIRTRQRERLYQSRRHSRCERTMLNRNGLSEVYTPIIFNATNDFWGDTPIDNHSGYEFEGANYSLSSDFHEQYDSDSGSCNRSPSPTSSLTSSTSTSTNNSSHDLPDFLLQCDESSPKFPRNKIKVPRSQLYKRGGPPQPKLRRSLYVDNGVETLREFQILKQALDRCETNHTEVMSLISNNTRVFLNAMRSSDLILIEDSLSLMTSLAAANLIHPNTLVNILNGLLMHLQRSVYQTNDKIAQQYNQLLLTILRSMPNSIPSIIDLMSSFRVLNDLENCIWTQTKPVSYGLTEFYYFVVEMMALQLKKNLSYPNNQGDESKVLQALSTLKACLTPGLISGLSRKYIEDSDAQIEARDHTIMALQIFTHAISLCCILEDTNWIIGIINAFKEADVEGLLISELEEGLNEGDSANCLMPQRQFLNFYQYHIKILSSSHGKLKSVVAL